MTNKSITQAEDTEPIRLRIYLLSSDIWTLLSLFIIVIDISIFVVRFDHMLIFVVQFDRMLLLTSFWVFGFRKLN